MKSKPPKDNICDAGDHCYNGHLCDFCLPFGHKQIFTPKQEEQIQKFLDENSDLMDDLAKDD